MKPSSDTIQEAAAGCRHACARLTLGDIVQHIHHQAWLETLREPIENRILFILSHKKEDEQAERLRRMRPFDQQKTTTEWRKAYANWHKAYIDWTKAAADWRQAYAAWAYFDEWSKTDADWQKIDTEYQKADADLRKIDVDLQEALAERRKAERSPAMMALHAEICGCPWSATTDIFGLPRP